MDSPKVLQEDSGADVFVACYQFFSCDKLSFFPRDFFDLILIDEAHHAAALSYRLIFEYFCEANFFYFTGTPDRADGKSLEARVVYSLTMADAVKSLFIKRPCFTPVPVEKIQVENIMETKVLSGFSNIVHNCDLLSSAIKQSAKAKSLVIGVAIEKLLLLRSNSQVKHQAILQAQDIKEATELQAMWDFHPENKDHGFKSVVVNSSQSAKDNRSAMQKFESGEFDAIIHVGILGEGYDHPPLSICCIFRRIKSFPLFVQLIGRVLRKVLGEPPERSFAFIVCHPGLGMHRLWKEFLEQDYMKPESGRIHPKLGGEKWTSVRHVRTLSDHTVYEECFQSQN